MPRLFLPSKFPNRLIVIDLERRTERMNCIRCGRLVEALWSHDRFCFDCWEQSGQSARDFFGEKRASK